MPFGYAAGQVLQEAVTETKTLDHDRLAAYIHGHSFKTVVGEISFGKDGEWSKPRQVLTQFQNVEPNSVDQFKNGTKQPIVWPPEYSDGKTIYPYENARRSRARDGGFMHGAEPRDITASHALAMNAMCLAWNKGSAHI